MQNFKQARRAAKTYIIKRAANCSKQGQRQQLLLKCPIVVMQEIIPEPTKCAVKSCRIFLCINPLESPYHTVYNTYQIVLIWQSSVTPSYDKETMN